tara:strand:+ start:422 stop:817 length:396 start_codon:yes stop_codon:yes gene_type:complete
MVTDGRKQPGIDETAKKHLDFIMANSDYFQNREGIEDFTDIEIVRIAVALAVKQPLKLLPPPKAVGSNVNGSNWNRDTWETEPSITEMVKFLVPESEREELWTYIEQAAATGLKHMAACVKKGQDISEILE